MTEVSRERGVLGGLEYEVGVASGAALDRAVSDSLLYAEFMWSELRSQINTSEDLIGPVQYLDMTYWPFFIDEAAFLTGQIQEVELTELGCLSTPLYGTESIAVEDFPCQSVGFTAVEGPEGYSLRMLYAADGVDEAGDSVRRWFCAPLSAVPSFVDAVSHEHVHSLLEAYAPSLMHEIDLRIFNSEGESGAAIVGLHDLDYSEIVGLAANDPVLYQRVSHMLAKYVTAVIGIDSDVPYLLDYDGDIVLDNGRAIETLDGNGLGATLWRVEPIHYEVDEDRKMTLGVSGVLRRDTGDDDQSVHFLVDSIKDAVSLRDYLYR